MSQETSLDQPVHDQTPPGLIAQEVSSEPMLDTQLKAIAIHLVPPTEMVQSSFWLGLFQQGSRSPSELLAAQSIQELFHEAATEGLTESGPLMLSDSSDLPAKFIYLLPKPNDGAASAVDPWLSNLVTTVKSWAPQKVGIYLAPELVQKEESQKLLKTVMRELIVATNTSDYYLIPGTNGINQALNTSLSIKQNLESEKIMVYVFH